METFWLSVLLTGLSMVALLPVLRRREILDTPGHRSSHSVAVPRGGGLACMFGVATAVVIAEGPAWIVMVPLVMGAVGFVDDVRSLEPWWRLVSQVAGSAALLVLADLGRPEPLRVWLAVAGVLFFVGFVNAFNFMDGINGISGLSAALSGVWFWHLGHVHGIAEVAVLGAATAGAGLAFLPWNAPLAKVFLGDSGSYFFGAALALLTVVTVWAGVPILSALAPSVIYLADTAWTLLVRLRRRKRVLAPHREHVYQQVAIAYGHIPTALLAVGAAGASILVASVATVPTLLRVGVLAILVASYLMLPRLLGLSAPARTVAG